MNTKNPVLIVALVALVAAGGFYKFAYSPKKKEAAHVKSQVADAQSRLDAARSLLASNQQAKQGYRADYATVVRLGKAVPGDDDVRSLMVQLNQAAKSSHVDFQSIDVGGDGAATAAASSDSVPGAAQKLPPGVTVGPAGFPEMPFSFTFKGGFFRLASFFAKLDDFVKASNDRLAVSGRLLTVDGVKLEPDQSGFPNIKATVQATSYLVSPIEGATGGATAAGPAGSVPAPAAGVPSTSGSTSGTSAPTTTTATAGVIR